jgi:hypothetical protein
MDRISIGIGRTCHHRNGKFRSGCLGFSVTVKPVVDKI